MGTQIHTHAGFAAAVLPISAGTVTTDTTGLIAGDVSIPTSDRSIPGYRAAPEKGRDFPTVLVVHEIFGVHEHIKDVCRRLAKLGYLAIAPDLYARYGNAAKIVNIPEIISNIVSKVSDAQVLSDLDAAVEWAENTGHGDVSRLSITGFCWGGRITWLYAAHTGKLKAAVAWYGRITAPKTPMNPRHPLDVAAQLKAPVLGLYGGHDQGIPVDTVEQMREDLKAAGKPCEIIIYPGAGHAFFADYRPSYHEEAAKDGWQRLQDWFKQHGAS